MDSKVGLRFAGRWLGLSRWTRNGGCGMGHGEMGVAVGDAEEEGMGTLEWNMMLSDAE